MSPVSASIRQRNLATFGEGGAVVTSNAALADAVRKLRSWGAMPRSGNYRMSAIEAAVLRVKLPHLRNWTARRQAIATRYATLLADTDIQLPAVMPYAGHVFHIYAVRSTHRDSLAHALQARGVEVAVHYRHPIHLQGQIQRPRLSHGGLSGGGTDSARRAVTPNLPGAIGGIGRARRRRDT